MKTVEGSQIDVWALLDGADDSVAIRVGEWELGRVNLAPCGPEDGQALLGAGSKAFLSYLQATSVRDPAKVAAMELAMGVVDQETSLVSVEDKEKAFADLAEPSYQGETRWVSKGPQYGVQRRKMGRGGGGSSRGRSGGGSSRGMGGAHSSMLESRGVPESRSYTATEAVPITDLCCHDSGTCDGDGDDVSACAPAPPPPPAFVPPKAEEMPTLLRWISTRTDPVLGHWSTTDGELMRRLASVLPGLTTATLSTLAAMAATTPTPTMTPDIVLTAIICALISHLSHDSTKPLAPFCISQAKSISSMIPATLADASKAFVLSSFS